MASLFYLISAGIMSVVIVIGLLASAFIVVVNLLEWAEKRKLNTCDIILMAQGIAFTCFQGAVIESTIGFRMWAEKDSFEFIKRVLVSFQLWTGITSYWLTAVLCFFYCVKIVDFKCPLLIWVKLRICKVVRWLILGSVVGSLIISSSFNWKSNIDCPKNSTNNLTDNSTLPDGAAKWEGVNWIEAGAIMFLTPLLLSAVSIILILTSLRRHALRMKESASEFSQPRLEAHFKAAKLVGALLLIYTFIVLMHIASHFQFFDQWARICWMSITFTFPAQSFTLILGNPRLKQVLLKVLLSCRK